MTKKMTLLRQGKFICTARFVYKAIQGALHKRLEGLQKHWSTLKRQTNKINEIKWSIKTHNHNRGDASFSLWCCKFKSFTLKSSSEDVWVNSSCRSDGNDYLVTFTSKARPFVIWGILLEVNTIPVKAVLIGLVQGLVVPTTRMGDFSFKAQSLWSK